MEIKCIKSHCRKMIKLTDNELDSYNHLIKSGFILSKFCRKHEREYAISRNLAFYYIDKENLRAELNKGVLDPVSFLFRKWNNENYGIDKINNFKTKVKQRLEQELIKN